MKVLDQHIIGKIFLLCNQGHGKKKRQKNGDMCHLKAFQFLKRNIYSCLGSVKVFDIIGTLSSFNLIF